MLATDAAPDRAGPALADASARVRVLQIQVPGPRPEARLAVVRKLEALSGRERSRGRARGPLGHAGRLGTGTPGFDSFSTSVIAAFSTRNLRTLSCRSEYVTLSMRPSRCHSALSFATGVLRVFAVASMWALSSSSVTATPSLSAIASSRSCPRTSSAPAGRIFSRRSSDRLWLPRSGFIPSIWRRRWYCISTARSTSDDATGIWFFLIQLAQHALACLAVDDLELLVLELLAERRSQRVEGLGLTRVLRELVIERGHVLAARLEDRDGQVRLAAAD